MSNRNRKRTRYYEGQDAPQGTPRDHVQPKDTPREVTFRGVTFSVDPNIFDDLEMLEIMHDMQAADDNPNGAFKIVDLLRRVTGDKYGAVKRVLRDEKTGRIPFEQVSEFLSEIMEELVPNS